MEKKLKIGIYGGTFNPPHNGHLRAAQAFLLAEKPDILYIMPAAIPPHKRISADDDPLLRLRLCELAFSGLSDYGSRVSVSDYEISKGGRSYTALTLEHFAAADRQLVLLCGTDMFLTLDTWFHPEIIFELADITFIRREKDDAARELIKAKTKKYKEQFGARIRQIRADVLELSSSELRDDVSKGKSIDGLVPDNVAEYIRENGLYQKQKRD